MRSRSTVLGKSPRATERLLPPLWISISPGLTLSHPRPVFRLSAAAALGVLTSLVASCGSAPTHPENGLVPGQQAAPSWTTDGRHPAYPEAAFLSAVGVADLADGVAESRNAADERARSGIVQTLRSRVQSAIELRSRSRNGVADVSVDELTTVVGAATLEGSEVVARYEDPVRGTFYSLAVVNRAVAARNLSVQVDEQITEANRVLDEALARDRARSFDQLMTSYGLFGKARLGQGTYRVLTGREFREVDDRGTQVRAQLEELFSDLAFEILSGQDQDASPGAPLPEQVVLRLVLRDGGPSRPVPGVRLRFEPEREGSVELASETARTNSRGEARLRVPLVRSTGEELGRIRIVVDEGDSGLRAPSTELRYTLPTRDTLDILIVLEESLLGRKQPASTMAVALQDRLRRAGFPVVDAGPLMARIGERRLLSASRRELEQLLGSKVDVVLRGRVEASQGGRVLGGLHAASARASLTGLDLRSGRVLAAIHAGPTPEAHSRLEEAARRAVQRLERSLAEGIEERLEKVLRGDE